MNSLLPTWQRSLIFGTGFGIVSGHSRMELAVVKLRPSGPSLVAESKVENFRTRPATEWGAEVNDFLKQAGESRLAATLLLPRDEVIVRTLALPGVSDRDVDSAVEIQADTLHPYGDEEVAWGWSRCGVETVMVGLVRKAVLEAYETLFKEAGVALAAISFSPAVIFPALRIWNSAPGSLLCFEESDRGRTEVYGESEGRAVFSADFSGDAERALALSRSELRLAQDYPAVPLSAALAARSTSTLAWAAALAGGPPRKQVANLLPPERRASHDRMQYLVPGVLGAVLAVALIVVFGILPALEAKRYREELDRTARSLEPSALRAQSLDRATLAARNRLASLDAFRRRPQEDLEVLNELTRLLQPPVWTSNIEILPDSVLLAGEADQAAPLLKILDSSPLFQNSEFTGSVARMKDTEQFRIKTMRRGRTGRKTP